VLKSREITIGNEMPNLYVITKGIEEGDKILLEGLRLVSENDKIEYEFKKPKDVIRDLNIHAE
jgi:membrane fusion protein (multidrug efflux system)